MNVTSKWISIVVVFAALYTIGVIFLAPISFSIYQVRLADALLPLSMIFGIPSAIGLGLGCLVSNIYGGLGIVDILGGTIANIIASVLAYYIARRRGVIRRFLGSVIETLTVTIIVGGYLSLIFAVPLEFGLFGVLVGSIIAINIIGFPIQEIMQQNTAIKEMATYE
jgi:uncharacterized membrane protein